MKLLRDEVDETLDLWIGVKINFSTAYIAVIELQLPKSLHQGEPPCGMKLQGSAEDAQGSWLA